MEKRAETRQAKEQLAEATSFGPTPAAQPSPNSFLRLPRTIGNRAMSRLLGGGSLQTKLAATSPGGKPLDSGVRSTMQARFGTDFSGVRVHTDEAAARSAESLHAGAYTIGRHMVFGRGKYNPSSSEGQQLLAHELSHVVQQSRGPGISPTRDGSGPLEAAADAAAAVFSHTNQRVKVHGSSAPGIACQPEEKKSLFSRGLSFVKSITPTRVVEAVQEKYEGTKQQVATVVDQAKEKYTAAKQVVVEKVKQLNTPENRQKALEVARKITNPSLLLADATAEAKKATEARAAKVKDDPKAAGGANALNRMVTRMDKTAQALAKFNTEPGEKFAQEYQEKGFVAAVKAWQKSQDETLDNLTKEFKQTVNDYEDGQFEPPPEHLVDPKAHPTLAKIESGLISADQFVGKAGRQVEGGAAKALWSMGTGIGNIFVHPVRTLRGLGELPSVPGTPDVLGPVGKTVGLIDDLVTSDKPAMQVLNEYGEKSTFDPKREFEKTKNLGKALGENYIEAVKDKRYGEIPGLLLVDVGSLFIPGGEAGKAADVAKVTGTVGEVSKAIGTTGEVSKALGTTGEVSKALGTTGEVSKAVGTAGDVSKAVGTAGEVTKEAELAKGASQAPEIAKGLEPHTLPAEPVPVEPKPTVPELKPEIRETKPVVPEGKPEIPEPKPIELEPKPKTPLEVEPKKTGVPETEPKAPETKPEAPETKPKATDAEPKVTEPEKKATEPETKPTEPEGKPEEPEKTLEPETKPEEPETKPVETEPEPGAKKPEVPEATGPTKAERAQLKKDLKNLKGRQKTAQRRMNKQYKLAKDEAARAEQLRQRALVEPNAAKKARMYKEAAEADSAARKALDNAKAAEKQVIENQLEIQKKNLQLSTDLRSTLPCFAAGTIVSTPGGSCAIEDLRVDDLVLAFDFQNSIVVPQRVLELFKSKTARFYSIEVDGGHISATSLHRFWVASEHRWIEARSLRTGMQLLTKFGQNTSVLSVQWHEEPGAATFNLRIEQFPTYFVGTGILVHNAGAPSYNFGDFSIYEGVNPKFPDKIYIGQTDDIIARQGQHRAEAEKMLQKPGLSPEEREFWEFKRDMVLKRRVSGLNADQANYLEQKNMDLESGIRGDKNVMNRREQVSRKNMPELEERIKADPKVKDAGLCP